MLIREKSINTVKVFQIEQSSHISFRGLQFEASIHLIYNCKINLIQDATLIIQCHHSVLFIRRKQFETAKKKKIQPYLA